MTVPSRFPSRQLVVLLVGLSCSLWAAASLGQTPAGDEVLVAAEGNFVQQFPWDVSCREDGSCGIAWLTGDPATAEAGQSALGQAFSASGSLSPVELITELDQPFNFYLTRSPNGFLGAWNRPRAHGPGTWEPVLQPLTPSMAPASPKLVWVETPRGFYNVLGFST